MKITSGSIVSAVIVALAGCGGGGSTSSSTPAPIVLLSIDQSKVVLGQSAKLTWSSTNATSCAASGSWAGTQATSGTATQLPTAPGQTIYILTCTGAGGNVKQSVALTVPIPVQKSSYLNAKNVGIAPVTIPAIPQTPSNAGTQIGRAYALGDFFQDGTLSMVAYASVASYTNTKVGSVYFFQKNSSGAWVDKTSALLKDTTGCVDPSKIIVADFNDDGKPDVFASCSGTDSAPFTGEQPRLLLSQPDGTYKNVLMPFTCYCHSASAADVNGNGYADLIVTDTSVANQPLYFVNNKDGTFTSDSTRFNPELLPWSFPGQSVTYARPIYSAEFIDFNKIGKFDIFFGGIETPCCANQPLSAFTSTIYPNDGTNHYATITPIRMPLDGIYNFPLDILFTGTKIFLNRMNSDYSQQAIQEVDYATLAANNVSTTHAGNYPNAQIGYTTWIIEYQGQIYSEDAAVNAPPITP